MRAIRCMLAAVFVTAAVSGAAQTADERVQSILTSAPYRNARTFFETDHDRFVRELIMLTEIPAPPFKEQKRAAAYLEMLRAAGLSEIETDPEGAKQSPPVVRTPNGSYADDQDYHAAGKPLWEPSEIVAPTLVVVGDWDGIQPPARAQASFSKLVNTPERRLVQIGEATHFVLLEKNRRQLYREVQTFLDE